jgi:hypothetical protein
MEYLLVGLLKPSVPIERPVITCGEWVVRDGRRED